MKENNEIICFVEFEQKSDGTIKENSWIPSSIIKKEFPKILIKFYETKIKFVVDNK